MVGSRSVGRKSLVDLARGSRVWGRCRSRLGLGLGDLTSLFESSWGPVGSESFDVVALYYF